MGLLLQHDLQCVALATCIDLWMAKALVDTMHELQWWIAPILIPSSGIQVDDDFMLDKWNKLSPDKANQAESFRDIPSPNWRS